MDINKKRSINSNKHIGDTSLIMILRKVCSDKQMKDKIIPIASLLLEHGADVNIQGQGDRSAFIWVCVQVAGHKKEDATIGKNAIELLLKYNCNQCCYLKLYTLPNWAVFERTLARKNSGGVVCRKR